MNILRLFYHKRWPRSSIFSSRVFSCSFLLSYYLRFRLTCVWVCYIACSLPHGFLSHFWFPFDCGTKHFLVVLIIPPAPQLKYNHMELGPSGISARRSPLSENPPSERCFKRISGWSSVTQKPQYKSLSSVRKTDIYDKHHDNLTQQKPIIATTQKPKMYLKYRNHTYLNWENFFLQIIDPVGGGGVLLTI